MALYRLKVEGDKVDSLPEYSFLSEGTHDFSPQQILSNNPEILLDLADLGLFNAEAFITVSEYNTARGPIDLLIITSQGEIVLVETKLLRNPESTRKVVAQVIDYIKSFSDESLDELLRKFRKRFPDQTEHVSENVNLASIIEENIRTGNFQVLIVGDYIHPNVLGMIESIQSAPHLAFTIHLVDLNTYQYSPEEILLQPRIVTSTKEVERSVIRIEIDPKDLAVHFESEIPEEEGRGRKPIISWSQYLENLSEPDFREIFAEFRSSWLSEVDDSINMGQVGFSAGVEFSGKRKAIQFAYDDRIPIVSERYRKSLEIPDPLYEDYLNKLRESTHLYDSYIASGLVEIPFDDLDQKTLRLILNAAIYLAKEYKQVGS